jgi:ubiquinone/menaquinone biosynthesis C-methylase UbiE
MRFAALAARTTRINPSASVNDPLTARTRSVWTAGDYDRISAGFRDEAEAFVQRLALTPDQFVLDAACGSGNLTIPAARTGAQVTGFDLVPRLLDEARKWATREKLAIGLDQGTVEELPYADGQFDVVMSMFGVMFAARAERVVSELTRVTRHGGRVALANWTRQGFVGQLLATHVAYVPPPPGVSSPLLWGDESFIREQFNERDWRVTTGLRTLTFRYPYAPADTAALFSAAYGPTVRAFEALDENGRRLLYADLVDHWVRHQRPTARTTEVDSEYLEVIATRR